MSITDVNPSATTRHGPSVASASQLWSSVPGLIRQIRDAPFVKGNPVNSDTYQ